MHELINIGREIITQSVSYPELVKRLVGLALDMEPLGLTNGIGRQVRIIEYRHTYADTENSIFDKGVQISADKIAVILPPASIQSLTDGRLWVYLTIIQPTHTNTSSVELNHYGSFQDIVNLLEFF